MIKIFQEPADPESLKLVAEDFKGYIKVVVDLKREIVAAGGEKHVDCESLLLKNGSQQEHLWGAGLDLETDEMDFDSMINLRPKQNTSREILNPETRNKVEYVTRFLLKGEKWKPKT